MFDFVRKHTRVMQVLLFLLIFPSFVLFGLEGYNRIRERGEAVAKVDGREILQADWDAAHKQEVERLREQAPNVLFRMNVARNGSRVDAIPGPDNRLDRQVPVSGTIGADYVADGAPVTLGGSFTFKGGGRVRTGLSQSEVLPIRRVLDAYASWKVDPRTQLRLSFQNILRQDYAYATSYFDDTGRTELSTITPTGTLIRLAVELSL